MKNQVIRERSRRTFNPALLALGSLTLGAAAMYLWDPQRGVRRRALVRDKAIHFRRQTLRSLGKVGEYMQGWLRGRVAEARSLWREEYVSDPQLHDRVRSSLGRAVSHSSSIQVEVHEGQVTLRGPVLAEEFDDLLEAVRHVRGVRDVAHRMDIYERAGDVPGLQGRGVRAGLRRRSSLGGRMMAIGGGGALVLLGLRRRGILGFLTAAAGVGVLTRAGVNRPVRRFAGIEADDTPSTCKRRSPSRLLSDTSLVFSATTRIFPTS